MPRRSSPDEIAKFFDSKVDCCAHKASAKSARFDRATQLLRRSLPNRVTDRSVLELGCGHGDLLRDLLTSGAASGTGIDLSPARIAEATARAQAADLGDRLTFTAGNAAAANPAPHDVVVMDKVICCYADWRGLLDATLPAARHVYAYTLPRTDGIWRSLMTFGIGVENLTHAVMRNGFRAYAHDVAAVQERVESNGFRLVDRGNAFSWTLAVFERD